MRAFKEIPKRTWKNSTLVQLEKTTANQRHPATKQCLKSPASRKPVEKVKQLLAYRKGAGVVSCCSIAIHYRSTKTDEWMMADSVRCSVIHWRKSAPYRFICCDWTVFSQEKKHASARFFNLFNAMAGESSPIICNGSSSYPARAFLAVCCLPFPVWICSRNLCRTKKSTLSGRQPIPPHASPSSFFPPLPSVSCPHSLLSPSPSFSLAFLWGEQGGKTDKAASTEITYHSLATCSALLSGKCWICQSRFNSGEYVSSILGLSF